METFEFKYARSAEGYSITPTRPSLSTSSTSSSPSSSSSAVSSSARKMGLASTSTFTSTSTSTSTKSSYFSSELSKILVKYDAEDCLELISLIIADSQLRQSVAQFSVLEVCDWIMSLSSILGDETFAICELFKTQWIDGEAFLSLDSNFWRCFQPTSCNRNVLLPRLLLSTICDGLNERFVNDVICRSDENPCVVLGIKADLSSCSAKKVDELVAADDAAISTGVGLIYGQLLVLGYKKFRSEEGNWIPLGENNCKFILKRKRVANGKVLTNTKLNASAYGSKFSFIADPAFDVYQIGRMDFTQANDFVIHGPIHSSKLGKITSPISRFACRVLCSRVYPFRSFVFSGGFDESNNLSLGDGAVLVFSNKTKTFDALTTFGVQLYCPKNNKWFEVSLRGDLFASRSDFMQGVSVGNLSSNELGPGSIIDICGVRILFSNFHELRDQNIYSPQIYMERLNALKPQCPVLLHSIQFVYLDQKERARRHMQRLIKSIGYGYMSCNDIKVPTTDYFDVLENNRSYVFPACGHGFSYHKSLEGKSCPLCRTVGPYVALCFEFEPSICDEKPTNVFNPCGHLASLDVCKYWSSLKMPTHENYDNRLHKTSCSHCPFCGMALSQSKPFTRLILQTESSDKDSDEYLNEGCNLDLSETMLDELSYWQSMYTANSNVTSKLSLISMVKTLNSLSSSNSGSSSGGDFEEVDKKEKVEAAVMASMTSNVAIRFPKFF